MILEVHPQALSIILMLGHSKPLFEYFQKNKILNRHGKESEITEDRSLKIRASCQTLQKALEMYKKF